MARFRPRRRSSAPVSTRRQSRLRRFSNMFPRFSPLARLRGLDVLSLFRKRSQKRFSAAYLPTLAKRHSLLEGLEPKMMLAANIEFNAASAAALEGDVLTLPLVGQLLVNGDLTLDVAADRRVDLVVDNSTASAGIDFTDGTVLQLMPRVYNNELVPIPASVFAIIGDINVEPNETVTVRLVPNNPAVLTIADVDGMGGAISLHTHNILDDDAAVFINAGHFDGNGNDLTVFVDGNQLKVQDSGGADVIVPQFAPGVAVINAAGGANNDTLRIRDSVLTAGIRVNYNGAGETGGNGDQLFIQGGAFNSITYSFETSPVNPHAGTIAFNGTQLIDFRGLEPVVQAGVAPTVTFNLTGVGDEATLIDVNGLGTMRLISDNNTFETVTFQAPTNRLVINTLGGRDDLEIDRSVFDGVGGNRSFDPAAGGPLASRTIEVNLDGGRDVVYVDAPSGTKGIDLDLRGGPTRLDMLIAGNRGDVHDILRINAVSSIGNGSNVTLRNLTIDDQPDTLDDPLITIQDARSTLRMEGNRLLADNDDNANPAATDPDPTMIEINAGEPDVDLAFNSFNSVTQLPNPNWVPNLFWFTNVPKDIADSVVFVRNNIIGNQFLNLKTDLEENTLQVTANEDRPLMIHLLSDDRTITAVSAMNGVATPATALPLAYPGKITYQTIPQFEGAQDMINFTYNTGGDTNDNPNANGKVIVDIVPINDAPVNSLQSMFMTNEETMVTLSSNLLGITDFDAGTATNIKVTFTVLHGTLSVNTFAAPAVVVTNNNTSSVMLQGSVSDINLVLQDAVDTDGNGPDGVGLKYTPFGPANHPLFGFVGTDTLTMTTNDMGNSGFDPSDMAVMSIPPIPGTNGPNAEEDTDTADIVVKPVNDAPINRLNGVKIADAPTMTFHPAVINEGAVDAPIPDIDVADDATEVNGNVTIKLTIDQGTIRVDTNAAGGVPAANISGNGTNMITLTGTASSAAVLGQIANTLDTLKYTPPTDFNGTANLTIESNDNGLNGGGNLTDTDVVKINVGAVNDAPVNTVPGAQMVKEDMMLVFSSGNSNLISINDIDAGSGLLKVTLTVNNGTLSWATTNNLVGVTNNAAMIMAQGTLAQLNAALNGLKYTPNLNYNGPDTLTINTNDQNNTGSGGPLQDTDTVAITVWAVNDAPVITVGGLQNPGTQSVLEDTQLLFDDSPNNNNNRVQITDVDGNMLEVTVSVSNGTLTLAQPNNVVFLVGDGVADTTITFTGTLAQVNNALSGGPAGNGLIYTPNANYFGPDQLSITANDLGFTGENGPQITNRLVDISVVPVNDAPINTFGGTRFENLPNLNPPIPNPPMVMTTEDVPFTFSGASRLNTGDIDANLGPNPTDMKVTVSIPGGTGTLSFGTTSGLLNVVNNTSTIMANGTLAEIQAALNNLVYTPALDYTTPAGGIFLTLTVNDSGNHGVDPGASGTATTEEDIDQVNLVVKDQNDIPTFNIGGTIILMEDDNAYPVDQNFTETIINYVTAISPGAGIPGESGPPFNQTVTFNITAVPAVGSQNIFTPTGAPKVVPGSFSLPGDHTADIEFEIAANAFGTAVVTVVATDNLGLQSVPQTFLIVVQPKNDNPQVVLPSAPTIMEDFMHTFSAANNNRIQIMDDSGQISPSQAITARFMVEHGKLEILSQAGLAVGGQNSAMLTLTGTVADIQAALNAGLKYTPTLHHNITRDAGAGSVLVSAADPDQTPVASGAFAPSGDRLKVEVNDFGHEGGQDRNPFGMGDQWDTRRILPITITPKPDAPICIKDFPPVSIPENGPTHTINLGVTGVVPANLNPPDPKAGQTYNLLGGMFFYDPDAFDSPPDNLTITVTNSNPALVTVGPFLPGGQTLAGSQLDITPNPNANSNTLGPATITVKGTDSQGNMTSKSFLVTIGAINLPPEVTHPDQAPGAGNPGNDDFTNEDTKLTFSVANNNPIMVNDADLPEDTNLTVSMNVPNGVLTLSQVTGLVFAAGDGTNDGSMTFTGSQANINAALNGLMYMPNQDFNGVDPLTITATDSVPQQGSLVVEINVASVNDRPIARDDLIQGIMEDTTANVLNILADNGNGPDIPGPPNESGQTLTIVGLRDAISGVVGFVATTKFGGTVSISPGSMTVSYTPRADYYSDVNTGPDEFQYIIRDNGTPNLDSVFGTTRIDVSPKNDQVVLDIGAANMIREDIPIGLGTVNNTMPAINTEGLVLGLQVRDDDPLGAAGVAPGVAGPSNDGIGVVELTLTATNGTFEINAQGGVTVGAAPGGVVLTGTVAAINATLNKSVYRPNADFNDNLGAEKIVATVNDLGNVGSGQAATTAMQMRSLMVKPVNDKPMVTFGSNVNIPGVIQVNQNSGMSMFSSFVTGRMPDGENPQGPGADEAGQTVMYSITNVTDPNNVLAAGGTFGNDVTLPDAGGDANKLKFTVEPGNVGTAVVEVTVMDNGGTANGGIDKKVQTFEIRVGINKEPLFNLVGNHPMPMNPQGDVKVQENSGINTITGWLANLLAGPVDDFPIMQSIQSIAISDPLPGSTIGIGDFLIYPEIVNLMQPAAPGIAPATPGKADLRFHARNNVSGVINLRITVVDNGGTANGGDDTFSRDFKIEIEGVNSPPTFNISQAHVSNEDAGPQSVSNFAFNIDPGPGEAGQTVNFNVIGNSNMALFSTQPTITSAGTLTYQAAPNANGLAIITVQAMDNGGGNDTSAPQAFAINVNPVNDMPTAMFTPDPVVRDENSGLQVVNNHLMVGVGGGPDEAGQTITSVVVTGNSNPGLFSVAPQFSVNPVDMTKYNLAFQSAPNAFGTANVTVTVMDNGGTTNGGMNTKVATFQIVINNVANAQVVDRHIFYKDSNFDGSIGNVDLLDDAAIDSSKDALLVGQTGTFANTTGYFRGINGIMIDVDDLANPSAAALADDLAFRTGNSSNTSTFTALNPANIQTIAVRQIGANRHRITVTFVDNSIRNRWLEVRLAASADTGLAAPEVHYWGNAVGNTGNEFTPGVPDVTAVDLFGVGQNVSAMPNKLVTDRFDLNKDRSVNAFDFTVIAGQFLANPFPISYITPNGALGSATDSSAIAIGADGNGSSSATEEVVGADQFSGGNAPAVDGRVGGGASADNRDNAFASLDESGSSLGDDVLDILAGDLAGSDL